MIHIDSHWGNYEDEAYDDENSCGYFTSNIVGEDSASYAPNKTCKFCGKTGLEWLKRPEGWRLGSWSGGVHNCPKKPLPSKSQPKSSSNVYTLLSHAIEGLHTSDEENSEYHKLMKHCKEQGLTVNDILKLRK